MTSCYPPFLRHVSAHLWRCMLQVVHVTLTNGLRDLTPAFVLDRRPAFHQDIRLELTMKFMPG
jgi:hypothetical protein